MTKSIKLSSKQKEIIAMMRRGWKLWTPVGPYNKVRLIKKREREFDADLFVSLKNIHGLIEHDYCGWGAIRYRLTQLGKEVRL